MGKAPSNSRSPTSSPSSLSVCEDVSLQALRPPVGAILYTPAASSPPATNDVINSETPTISFSGNEQSNSTTSPSKMRKGVSGTTTAKAKEKKTKLFDETAFLGPKIYMPRMKKSDNPYLHYDGYLYRKSSPTRYLCNRYMHPILENEWLTYNQATVIVKYLNAKKNNNDKQFQLQACPGVLTIDGATINTRITTNHTCDMPHCNKRAVTTPAFPSSDHAGNSQLSAFSRGTEIDQGASHENADAGAFNGGDDDDNSVSSSTFSINSQLSAFRRDTEIDQGASHENADAGAFNGGDDYDNNSVSSSKSYYKDLCVRLTFALKKRKATDKERKNKIKLLKEEIAQLRR